MTILRFGGGHFEHRVAAARVAFMTAKTPAQETLAVMRVLDNDCHDPNTGQFCSTGGGQPSAEHIAAVGVAKAFGITHKPGTKEYKNQYSKIWKKLKKEKEAAKGKAEHAPIVVPSAAPSSGLLPGETDPVYNDGYSDDDDEDYDENDPPTEADIELSNEFAAEAAKKEAEKEAAAQEKKLTPKEHGLKAGPPGSKAYNNAYSKAWKAEKKLKAEEAAKAATMPAAQPATPSLPNATVISSDALSHAAPSGPGVPDVLKGLAPKDAQIAIKDLIEEHGTHGAAQELGITKQQLADYQAHLYQQVNPPSASVAAALPNAGKGEISHQGLVYPNKQNGQPNPIHPHPGKADAAPVTINNLTAEQKANSVKVGPYVAPPPSPAHESLPVPSIPGAKLVSEYEKLHGSAHTPDANTHAQIISAKNLALESKLIARTEALKLTADERLLLKAYTGSTYSTLNGQLRVGGKYYGKTPPESSRAGKLMSAINKAGALDEPMIVYRGTGEFTGHDAPLGSTIHMEGFVSTSIAKDSAFGGKSFALTIRAKTGLYVKKLSNYTYENELLMNHGTKLRIVGREKKGYVTHIMMEEV